MMGAPHHEVPGAILLGIGVFLLVFRRTVFRWTRVKASMSGAMGFALTIGGVWLLFVT